MNLIDDIFEVLRNKCGRRTVVALSIFWFASASFGVTLTFAKEFFEALEYFGLIWVAPQSIRKLGIAWMILGTLAGALAGLRLAVGKSAFAGAVGTAVDRVATISVSIFWGAVYPGVMLVGLYIIRAVFREQFQDLGGKIRAIMFISSVMGFLLVLASPVLRRVTGGLINGMHKSLAEAVNAGNHAKGAIIMQLGWFYLTFFFTVIGALEGAIVFLLLKLVHAPLLIGTVLTGFAVSLGFGGAFGFLFGSPIGLLASAKAREEVGLS